MTTFVTGGTSSIGRVLIKDSARRGESLRVLVRKSSNRAGLELPGVEFVYGDVTDPQAVRAGMAGCERVTHMAAVVGSSTAPEAEWWRVNRDGTRTVFQAAVEAGVRSYVQVSSISVLGSTAPGELADETRPVDPSQYQNLYQKTKHAADVLVQEAAAKGLNAKIVYPCFGFGCSWASSHVSMQEMTLLRLAAGKPAAVMGSGKNVLTLAYYADTVAGIRLAHEKGEAGQDFILGGARLTFPEIWAVIAEVLGKRPPRVRVPLAVIKLISNAGRLFIGHSIFPSDFLDMVGLDWNFSSAKAERLLGWKAHAFKDAVAETWAEYQAGK
jgi:dihydroflavonol-4-reductase